MRVSIVVPALNEEAVIERCLSALAGAEGAKEIVVVDGGSTDRTVERARRLADRVLTAPRGRGSQMQAGALAASGDVLWFVHADAIARADSLRAIETALSDDGVVAGNFRLEFDGPGRSARQLTAIYPWLRLLGLSYGDAGIFVRREAYEAAGGFRPYPLFEDLDLIRRLKRRGRFAHLDCTLAASSRRFEHRNFGVVWANWIALQVLFWAGVSPYVLARWYRHIR
ncbi:MAG: TIGR04283 family arsenosugar biosynthesis glycosyltransferase [Acidobacteria bacterium]|nr:TIGR04283 family arsenosugar biosynthesis glycosyltransferase [Acidobacteriota bacterium]